MNCSRCLFDETTPNISFNGTVCNYCEMSDRMDKMFPIDESKFEQICEDIKKNRKSDYDVVIGISGGCDSSYLMLLAKKYGLNPLAVHFDNTWNSAIASQNMRRMLEKLKIDLYTYVVDCQEYDSLYRAFITAGTTDIECPTDIGVAATLYNACTKYNIKYIFEGHSFRTEGICPIGWNYMDSRYIEDVYRVHGFSGRKLKSFPHMWLYKQLYWMCLKQIKKIRPLYYVHYDKSIAKRELCGYGWKWYGGSHQENSICYFYHKYYLHRKFNVCPQYNQYSSLVRSGTISRQEALDYLFGEENQSYDKNIISYVMNRLSIDDELITNGVCRTHRDYKNYRRTFRMLKPLFRYLSDRELIPRTFYEKYTNSNYV